MSAASSSSASTEESLWLKLLRQSASKKAEEEASCLIVGDENVGKRSLLSRLGQVDTFSPAMGSTNSSLLEMVSYNYIDVDDSALESTTKIHLWSLDDRMFLHSHALLPSPVRNAAPHKLMYLIAIDLTKGEECISSLKKWLKLSTQHLSALHQQFPKEDLAILRKRHMQNLVTARLQKKYDSQVDSRELDELINLQGSQFDYSKESFYVPFLVVGCKVDQFNLNDVTTLRSLKELQGKLRLVCLEAGAALAFASSNSTHLSSKDVSEDSTTVFLRDYVIHRLYNDKVRMALSIEERLERTVIPSGFDTTDLISISTGQKPNPAITLQSTLANLVIENHDTKNSTTSQSMSEIPSEQDWLSELQAFISSVGSAGEPALMRVTSNLSDRINEAADADHGKSKQSLSTRPVVATTSSTVPATTTRRASTRTGAPSANGDKTTDVKDFFTNLLANPGASIKK